MCNHNVLLFLITLLCTFFASVIPLPAQEFTDDEGQTVPIDHPFSRIISLYPAHTENLASLGCLDRLIGVGPNDDYPEAASALPRISYRDNTEKFLAANPDLVLIRPMISRSQPELIAQLRASGITVVSLQPTSAEQMFTYWRRLAQLCGQPAEAERLQQQFRTGVEQITSILPPVDERPKVYFESIHRKMKTFAPEAISMFALKNGGGRNIATDATGRNSSNIAPYGKERILAKGEEIDVFLSQVGRMNAITPDEIYAEPGFTLIKAVRDEAVCLIDEKIVSRPTMRLLLGIQAIYNCLYPTLNQPSLSFTKADYPLTQPRRQ